MRHITLGQNLYKDSPTKNNYYKQEEFQTMPPRDKHNQENKSLEGYGQIDSIHDILRLFTQDGREEVT